MRFWPKWGCEANRTWARATLDGVMKIYFARFYPYEVISTIRFVFFGASVGAISVLARANIPPDSQIA